jgi:hypothetical protein
MPYPAFILALRAAAHRQLAAMEVAQVAGGFMAAADVNIRSAMLREQAG